MNHEMMQSINHELLKAVCANDCETVGALLAEGADIEARGHYGDTPLQRAESYGFEKVAKLPVESGAKR